MWVSARDGLYEGDCQPGDRKATADEVAARQAAGVTLAAVKDECRRRILDVASMTDQTRLLGMALLVGSVAPADRTPAQMAFLATFRQALIWINQMRAACAPLVGKPEFRADASWPALPAELAAFQY